jgi:signal transduction histidine kinase
MDTGRKQVSKARTEALTQWVQAHLPLLSWIVPLAMFALVVGYEVGPSRWIHESLGYRYHLAAEILFYATLGPALAFAILKLLQRWLEERDTSDLQAHLLARTRAEAEGSRQLNDDALQVLFAAGVLIDMLKAGNGDTVPPDLRERIDQTEKALQEAVAQLRSHLLEKNT